MFVCLFVFIYFYFSHRLPRPTYWHLCSVFNHKLERSRLPLSETPFSRGNRSILCSLVIPYVYAEALILITILAVLIMCLIGPFLAFFNIRIVKFTRLWIVDGTVQN